jgi:hypothetical protein
MSKILIPSDGIKQQHKTKFKIKSSLDNDI